MRFVRPGFVLAITLSITACGDEPEPPPPAAPVLPATPAPPVKPAVEPPAKPPDADAAIEAAMEAAMEAPPPVPGKLVMPDRQKVEVDPAKQEAVKQRLLSLFPIIKAMKFSEGASYVVYRGEDPTRKRWHELCDYAKDKEHVDEVLARVGRLLQKGEPVFERFEARKESEGVWLGWFVSFGPKKAVLACLEIDGTFAIGDID